LTITAQYQQYFRVTYNANTSAFSNGDLTWVEPNIYYAGDTVTLLGNKAVGAGLVIPAGYSFAGWCMDKTGTGLKYGPRADLIPTLDMPAGDVTLYALFTSLNQPLHVTYDANASKFNNGDKTWVDTNVYIKGDKVTAVGNKAAGSGLVIPAGYSFAGWSMDKDGTGIKYGPRADLTSTFVMPGGDVTLYAQFIAQTFTVKFVDWNGTLLNAQTVEYGSAASAPDDPARVGYKFIGWGVDFGNITGDLMITAQYQQYLHVTYNANAAAFSSGGAAWNDPNDYLEGDTVTALGQKQAGTGLVIPAGYTFAGWSMTPDGVDGLRYGPRSDLTSTFVMPGRDVTLYAQLTRNAK